MVTDLVLVFVRRLNTPMCEMVSPVCPQSQLGDEGPLNRDEQYRTTANLSFKAVLFLVSVSFSGDLNEVKVAFVMHLSLCLQL